MGNSNNKKKKQSESDSEQTQQEQVQLSKSEKEKWKQEQLKINQDLNKKKETTLKSHTEENDSKQTRFATMAFPQDKQELAALLQQHQEGNHIPKQHLLTPQQIAERKASKDFMYNPTAVDKLKSKFANNHMHQTKQGFGVNQRNVKGSITASQSYVHIGAQHKKHNMSSFVGLQNDVNFFDEFLEKKELEGNMEESIALQNSYYRGGQGLVQQFRSRKNSEAEILPKKFEIKPVQFLDPKAPKKHEELKQSKFAKHMAKFVNQETHPEKHQKDNLKKGESYKPDDRSFKRLHLEELLPEHPKTPNAQISRFDILRKSSDSPTDLPQFGQVEAPIMIKREESNKPDEYEEDYAIHDSNQEYKLSIMKKRRTNININVEVVDELDLEKESNNIPSQAGIQFQQSQKRSVSNGHSQQQLQIAAQTPSHIMSKSMRQHRMGLMNKLAMTGVWAPVQSKPITHQSIIIFDWDDTLMSSTFLSPFSQQIMQSNIRSKLPKQVKNQLDILETQVISLLKKALTQGQTFIITNAGQGWVELSSLRFLPKLYKEVIENASLLGLTIISARSMFEKEMPTGFTEWKTKAFLKISEEMDQNAITNIIAIGDSQIEMDAANHLAETFGEAVIKTVKLKEQPTLVELTKQVELINNSFDEICNSGKNLTIRLQKVLPDNGATQAVSLPQGGVGDAEQGGDKNKVAQS